MASLEFRNTWNDNLRWILEGLQIELKPYSDEVPIDKASPGYYSFDMQLTDYEELEKTNPGYYYPEFYAQISDCYPFHRLIEKSNILTDGELFEAILCSRIFDSPDKYEACQQINDHVDQVWVHRESEYCLVRNLEIVYTLSSKKFEKIRDYILRIWVLLRKNVYSNLREAFLKKLPASDQSKSSSQSSAAVSPVTDQVRTQILDELNSINPDPLLRRRFELDLNVQTDKDLHFWQDRLELVRICAESSTSSSLMPPSDLENISRPNETCLASSNLSQNLPQTISRFEQLVEANEKQLEMLSATLSKLSELTECPAASRETENAMYGEKLQQLMVPTVEQTKTQNETCLAILTRLKNSNGSRGSPEDFVDHQPSPAAKLDQHTDQEATATRPSSVAEKLKEWKLDEKKLQSLMRAVTCLADIIKENGSAVQQMQPSNNSSFNQFDLVENICSYKLFSEWYSCFPGPLGSFSSLSTQIRSGISYVLNLIQCQRAISGFLGSQMVDISSPWSNRDFLIQLVVVHQLAKILKENVESSSNEIEDCVTRLENFAKEWNIDLPN